MTRCVFSCVNRTSRGEDGSPQSTRSEITHGSEGRAEGTEPKERYGIELERKTERMKEKQRERERERVIRVRRKHTLYIYIYIRTNIYRTYFRLAKIILNRLFFFRTGR